MLSSLLVLLFSIASLVPDRPYAGQQRRVVKSLSEEDVEARAARLRNTISRGLRIERGF